MFAKWMGTENMWPEVLQDAFFEKERPNRKKEGVLVIPIFFMMITLLSFWQVERGTLQTSRRWMAIWYASAVDMLPIDNGVEFYGVNFSHSYLSYTYILNFLLILPLQ